MNREEVASAIDHIKQAGDTKALESLRLKYLGRRGVVTLALRGLAELPVDRRKSAGQELNNAKVRIEQALKSRRMDLLSLKTKSVDNKYDLTAPVIDQRFGSLHPVEELQKELIQIFWQIGFSVANGPEIETDWYNFDALNIPKDHPARDMQDTFYLENGAVPRTHTSSVQIRYMEKHQPPIRIIAPGKVYRNEDEDATHIWSFRQLEALVVDEGVALADLKGTLLYMLQSLFGKDTKLQLRPNYFPYVEPALEMDATCVICKGKNPDCKTCKGTGWVELGGAGMVHPQVLKNVGIDPARYSGFAFGFGIERMAAIKYQVDDIRQFWRPDVRFLEQF